MNIANDAFAIDNEHAPAGKTERSQDAVLLGDVFVNICQ
jgi:hypothetical protein